MEWEWEQLAGPGTITEGPVWDGAGLLYTAIADNEIRRYDPATGAITTVYRDTGGANGLALGPDGALYACAGTGRAMVRHGADGTRTVLADRFEGRRLNSPNDLAFDSAGGIWFTDPRYGDDHSDRELDHDSVYRIAPSAGRRRGVDDPAPDLRHDAPERVCCSPGTSGPCTSRRVTTTSGLGAAIARLPDPAGRNARRADRAARFRRGARDRRHVLGRDGRIVATCGWELSGPGSRIAVFATDGTVLEEHPLPAGRPTNCAFGEADLATLYVTTLDGRLYRVPNTGRRGYLRPPEV